MAHRKHMRAVVKSRSQLANKDTQLKLKIGRVFVVESLAGALKWLLFQCRQLQAAKRINSCWFYNGNINVVLEEKGDRNHISHQSDLLKLLDMTEDELKDIVAGEY